jgi:hypothetical protein
LTAITHWKVACPSGSSIGNAPEQLGVLAARHVRDRVEGGHRVEADVGNSTAIMSALDEPRREDLQAAQFQLPREDVHTHDAALFGEQGRARDTGAAAEIEHRGTRREPRQQITQESQPRVAPDLVDPLQVPVGDQVVAGVDEALRLEVHQCTVTTSPHAHPRNDNVRAASLQGSAHVAPVAQSPRWRGPPPLRGSARADPVRPAR